MQLQGTRKLSASPQAVWAALHNGAVLQNCVPGAEQVMWQGDSAVTALLNVGIGPFKGEGESTAQAAESVVPSHRKLVFNRSGAHNSAEGSLTVDLAPDGAGTLLSYNCNATIGGMAAALDNRLTRPLLDQQLGKFFERLDEQAR